MKKMLAWILSLALLFTCMSGLVIVNAEELATYMGIDFNNANGPVLTGVKETTGVSTAIPGTGLYGAPLNKDWSGVDFKPDDIGITPADIDNGTELKVTLQYYLPAAYPADNGQVHLLAAGGTNAVLGTHPTVSPTQGGVLVNTQELEQGKVATYTFQIGNASGFANLAKAILTVEWAGWAGFCHNNGFNNNPFYILSFTIEPVVEGEEPEGPAADYIYIDFNTADGAPETVGAATTASGSEIAGMGAKGFAFTGDWSGFGFTPADIGLTAADVDNGAELKVTVEYYTAYAGVADQAQVVLDGAASLHTFANGTANWGGTVVNTTDLVQNQIQTYSFTLSAANGFGDLAKKIVSGTELSWAGHCYNAVWSNWPFYLLSMKIEEVTGGSEEPENPENPENPEISESEYVYINFNTADGKVETIGAATTVLGTAIPGLEAKGFAFTGDWSGFGFTPRMSGITAEDIDNGTAIAVTVEYYVAAAYAADQGQIVLDGAAALCMFGDGSPNWGGTRVNNRSLAQGQIAKHTFVLSAENGFGDLAKKFVNGLEIGWAAHCYSGAFANWPFYMLSMKVEKHIEVEKEKADYIRLDFGSEAGAQTIGVYSQSIVPSDIKPIPNTNVNGAYLGGDWSGFNFVADDLTITPEDIDNGKELTVRVEYYLTGGAAAKDGLRLSLRAFDAGVTTQLAQGVALYNVYDSVIEYPCVNQDEGLVPDTLTTVTFTLGKNAKYLVPAGSELNVLGVVTEDTYVDTADLAKAILGGATVYMVTNAWNHVLGRCPLYIKSVTIYESGTEDSICWHENTHVEGATDADCFENGYTGDIICDDCGHVTLGVVIPSHEHENREQVEPTCVRNGLTAGVWCTECEKYVEGAATIPSHNTELHNVKKATCAAKGYSGDVWCLDCDTLAVEGVETAMLPHTWNDGEITKEATAEEKGECTYTCTACGATKVVDVALGDILGDVNGDGLVDSTDARLVLQLTVRKISASSVKVDFADVDNNGKIDSTDARLILQYSVGKIDNFTKK